MPLKELMTAQEVADYFGWKLITIYRLTRKRKIDVVILGKEYRYTKEAVEKFLKDNTLPAKPKDTTTEVQNG